MVRTRACFVFTGNNFPELDNIRCNNETPHDTISHKQCLMNAGTDVSIIAQLFQRLRIGIVIGGVAPMMLEGGEPKIHEHRDIE